MARDPWFDMSREERRKRAARHCGGGLDQGSQVIKPAPKKPAKKAK